MVNSLTGLLVWQMIKELKTGTIYIETKGLHIFIVTESLKTTCAAMIQIRKV